MLVEEVFRIVRPRAGFRVILHRKYALVFHPYPRHGLVVQVQVGDFQAGVGFCNITKCCTEVCPEAIHITDNAIIPLKERVVDRFYDPIRWILDKVAGK